MILTSGREAISEILGLGSQAKGRPATDDLFTSTLTAAPRLHKTYRAGHNEDHLPAAVVPYGSDFDEFFATVATYYSSQVPITAYVHVIGEDLERFIDAERTNLLVHDLSPSDSLALIGASLGETALAALHGSNTVPNASYSSCRRSLSYVVARTAKLYQALDPRQAIERWDRLRRLTGLPVSPIAVQAVLSINAIASNLKELEPQISLPKAFIGPLSKQIKGRDKGEAARKVFADAYPRIAESFAGMSGPFDSRMTAFLDGVQAVQTNSHGAEVDSVAVAFLCNSIFPGSFAHSRVLARLVDFFPSALIWYGVFATTSAEFDARGFGSGIVFKLMRDLGQPFSFAMRPQCDISLDEFEVLARATIKPESLKSSQNRTAIVSLLPGVDVLSRVLPEEEGGREIDRDDVSAERLEHAARLVEEASSLLREIAFKDRKNSGPFAKRKKR